MSETITVVCGDRQTRVKALPGETLLQLLARAGMAPDSPCGGNGTCGKCRVLADGKEILACSAQAQSVSQVCLKEWAAMKVARHASGIRFPITPADGFAVAVDIGTTTVAAYLVSLQTGQTLQVLGQRNAQASWGADVISRIQAGRSGSREAITAAIRGQLAEMTVELCRQQGIATDFVCRFCIAGNTVMLHFLAGLDASGIAQAPFTPASLFGSGMDAASLGLPCGSGAEAFLMPCLAGYVGGDITAGLLSCGIHREESPCLFIDLGTNGEMAIGSRDGFVCCATAAGPAFEGAEIECGSSAVNGAVDHVAMENGKISFTTIGSLPAANICGSGLMDLLAVLLQLGAVDETGRLLPPDETEKEIPGLEETDDGVRFCLTDQVYLTERDVRQLQLAKAAVAAGILTLLEEQKLSLKDISHVWLAGGFGGYLDQKSAAAIGLFPAELLDRVAAPGNSAGLGAVDWLISEEARAELTEIIKKADYLELSGSLSFQNYYIDCMYFEEE